MTRGGGTGDLRLDPIPKCPVCKTVSRYPTEGSAAATRYWISLGPRLEKAFANVYDRFNVFALSLLALTVVRGNPGPLISAVRNTYLALH